MGTLEAFGPLIADSPFVKDGTIDRLIELCSDETLLTLEGSTLCLWGRRPSVLNAPRAE